MKMADLRRALPEWFSRQNKRFFNDVSYRLLRGRATNTPFLVRLTAAWTDMFGQPKRFHYRVNPIRFIDGKPDIAPLIDTEFADLPAVKEWLKSQ